MPNENKLLANLFLNLKGSKKKREDWISIAKKCKKIVTDSKDRKEAAQKLGVSTELIRAILNLLELPDEVQQLIKEGKILFDAAQRINTIKLNDTKKEQEKRIEVAKTISGLSSHEQREIIQYAKKFPNSSLKDFTKRVSKHREVRQIHVVVLPLENDVYYVLQNQAKRKKISLEKIILEIIEEWEKRKGKGK